MARTILCFFFFFLCLVALLHPSYSGAVSLGKRNVPAMFVFGDSIVDGGNNVFVDPNCTTDTLPYGYDFPTGPTGRFTNGRNPGDFLSQHLRFPRFLPALKDPKTTDGMIQSSMRLPHATFFFAFSLYLHWNLEKLRNRPQDKNSTDISGSGKGTSLFISLNQQIKYFQNTTIPELRTQFNNTRKLSSYLAKSIFVFNSGGNDIEQECSGPVRKEKCASDEFLESLLANFTHQLKTAVAIPIFQEIADANFSGKPTVYNLGARKFVLFGVQANGCNPQHKPTLQPTEKCKEDINNASKTFNSLLRSSIDRMNKSLPGSNFVFVNTYGIVRNVFDNPQSYGFKVVNQSCCTISHGMRGGACEQYSTPCMDRKTYMYYDGAHFTEALYKLLVKTAYNSTLPTEVYPFNVAYLAGLT
ncbi:hypothetical protein EJ110_NYTH15739 [Nymphaea thermarum]|nr:hypothetical protein EJ110_NYTH15739 [Nymphaea thermarum]